MYRGTTPDYLLTINADLTGMTVFVTISQGATKVTQTGDDFVIGTSEESSTIAFRQTQQQTLRFHPGNAEVQVRFIDQNGKALATNIKPIMINKILQEGVIEHE